MNQLQKIWTELTAKQELGLQKVDLGKAEDIVAYVRDIAVDHLRNMKNLSNAGFDALQEAGDILNMMKDVGGQISKFEKAAKELGIDIPNDIKQASQDLNSINEGLKVVRKVAQEATKI